MSKCTEVKSSAVCSGTVNIDTPSCEKRKRGQRDSSSSTDSISPYLDQKRIKQRLSLSFTESESVLEADTIDSLHPNMEALKKELLSAMADMKTTILEEIKQVKSSIDESVKKLGERTTTLEEENETLKDDLTTVTIELAELKTELAEVKDNLKEVTDKADKGVRRSVDNEQYSRKSNIKIYGLQEDLNENPVDIALKLFEEKLNITIVKRDVDVAHRVGKRKPGQHRGLLVKFIHREDKSTIIKARRQLKGSGITIADDLSQDMQMLFNRVKNDSRLKDSWTWDGKVFVKTKDDKVFTIAYGQRLDEVIHVVK